MELRRKALAAGRQFAANYVSRYAHHHTRVIVAPTGRSTVVVHGRIRHGNAACPSLISLRKACQAACARSFDDCLQSNITSAERPTADARLVSRSWTAASRRTTTASLLWSIRTGCGRRGMPKHRYSRAWHLQQCEPRRQQVFDEISALSNRC